MSINVRVKQIYVKILAIYRPVKYVESNNFKVVARFAYISVQNNFNDDVTT